MAVLLRSGHTHEFHAYTTVDNQHRHHVATISGRPRLRTDGSHVHLISSWTTFDRLHIHRVNRYSGPGISVGSGRHVHRVSALTTVRLDHRHRVSGRTLRAPNIPQSVVRQALSS